MFRALKVVLCTALAFLIMGCAGPAPESGSGSQISQAPTITVQPLSQSVPLGQAATFTVVATGGAPLNYQWSENGTPIMGATSASYTSPEVTASDSGSKFTVTVSNSVNSVTSNVAILTVGPRSPKAGDLRFQEVGSPSEAEQGLEGSTLSVTAAVNANYSPIWCDDCVGSPLTIGDDGGCQHETSSSISCIWGLFTTPLPPGQSGLNTYYLGQVYANFDSNLTSSPVTDIPPPEAPESVITSLDFQPAYNTYAIAWIQTTQQDGAFDLRREIVSPGAIQSTVAADAAQSRVVTAVSFDANGQANLLSYGWQGDATTIYDAEVLTATAQPGIESAVQTLAGQGYILTAFGGDATNGFVLIGTKVHGDTLARPIEIADQSTGPCYHCSVGYAPVLWYRAPQTYYSVIYEK